MAGPRLSVMCGWDMSLLATGRDRNRPAAPWRNDGVFRSCFTAICDHS